MFGLITAVNGVLIKSISIPEKFIDITIDVLDGSAEFTKIFKAEAVHAGKVHAEESRQELSKLMKKAK